MRRVVVKRPLPACPGAEHHSIAEGLYHEKVARMVRVACTCGVSGPFRPDAESADLAWAAMLHRVGSGENVKS